LAGYKRIEGGAMQNFKFWFIIFIFAFCIFDFTGCSTIKETAKSVAGISTKALEEKRAEAIRKQFSYDLNSCFSKAESILERESSYIYAKDPNKHMIAIYVSISDTTPVGIFFKEIDATNTEIEVTSASTYAKEAVAKRLFYALEGKPRPEEERGLPNAKKETGY
jgi:hypothetical protein